MTPGHQPAFLPQQDLCGCNNGFIKGVGGDTESRQKPCPPQNLQYLFRMAGPHLTALVRNLQGFPGAQRVKHAFTLIAIIPEAPTSLSRQTLRPKLEPVLSSLPKLLQVLQAE